VRRVTVLVLHLDAGPLAGPLTRGLSAARRRIAEDHLAAFRQAGADAVELVAGPPDDTPFGTRLRALVRPLGRRGAVILGSGALSLARPADRRAFVAIARTGARVALANDRYSADAVAVGRADLLSGVPPGLEADNGLPRWLAGVGVRVADLRQRWRLLVDVDSPLDLVLVGLAGGRVAALIASASKELPLDRARTALAAVATIMSDSGAELLVAGRTSARSLGWLERRTACRVRALVEERGLRSASAGPPNRRLPASVLGSLLDRDGPEALGTVLAGLADGAVIDTRVLLAHRLGPAEERWPSPEDRFASDLLLPELVADPWLRVLTEAAAGAPIPIVLGGHTPVGPGLRLIARLAGAGRG
jgi:hypothetical protein